MLAATPKLQPPKESAEAGGAPTGQPAPAPPPPPDRSALDAAEATLTQARDRLAHELDAIAQERAELDRQEQRARRDGEAELKRLERRRTEAERAYRKAGGQPEESVPHLAADARAGRVAAASALTQRDARAWP